jgi:hypothetical protein
VSNGGSDSGDGSCANPWGTITHAASMASAGSVIHVAAGTYDEQVVVSNSGTSNAPITFVCDTPRQCFVRGTNYSGSYGTAAILLIGSYINIENFDVTDGNGAGDEGIEGYGSPGVYQIVGNYVHDIPIPDCNSDGGTGIGPEAIGAGQGHSYVAGNWVTNIGSSSTCGRANGIYLSGTGSVAVNNVVENSWGAGFDVAHAANGAVVAFNTVDSIQRGNGVGGDGVFLGCDTSGCNSNVIVNNILTNNTNAGIESYEGDSGDPAGGDVFDHNLFYGDGATCSFPSGSTGISCTNSISANPMYVTPGSNFQLQAGSPAIGAASATDAPATDYNGTARTAPYNIGAY